MGDWLSLVAIGVAVVGGGFGMWQAFLNRSEARVQRRTPAPPTTVEVWARLDRVEGEVRAVLGVLYDVAEQWPEGAEKPRLDPRYVAVLGDKLPLEWRNRVS